MTLTTGTNAYRLAHKHVMRARGRADAHPCANGCGEQAHDWSNISGEYLGPDDYRPLCKACHISVDRRRAHDEREDHRYEPVEQRRRGRSTTTCVECRRRRRRRIHAGLTPEQRRKRRYEKAA